MTQDSHTSHNLTQQRELYGAPLGDTVQRIATTLAISQAAVARTIGLSAPMLSQLASGQRVKIANPKVVDRLHSLLALTREVEAGMSHQQIAPRLSQIEQDDVATLTRERGAPVDVPGELSWLLRAVASGRELTAAAGVLQADFPELAEVLRVYGTGRPHDAAAHYATITALVQR